ncbi:putative leader peptide [Streptomyces collinus]
MRSALLTTRGHIDLLRVASAACRRGLLTPSPSSLPGFPALAPPAR